jgi:hypothetical protein
MRTIWSGDTARSPVAPAPSAARWKRRLTAGLVTSAAAIGLVAASVTAASAAPPPPAAGVDPAVVAGSSIGVNIFYTAGNGTVWTKSPTGTATQVSNGVVSGGVSGAYDGTHIVLFGEAAGAVWYATRTGTTWSSWSSLGAPTGLTATPEPGAVARGATSGNYSVYARASDGNIWARDHNASGWGSWHRIGAPPNGDVLAGTGPAAAYIDGLSFVLVVSGRTPNQMYIAQAGQNVFRTTDVYGYTDVTPALTTVPGALVGFARGTDHRPYYHVFNARTPGWHLVTTNPVGNFSSSLGAANATVSGGPSTKTVGLGSDSQVYLSTGTWPGSPGPSPSFTGWAKVTG